MSGVAKKIKLALAEKPVHTASVIPQIPFLSETQQAVLNAFLSIRVAAGESRLVLSAKDWAIAAGLVPPGTPRRCPQMETAVRRLDRATDFLRQYHILAYTQSSQRDGPRMWTYRPQMLAPYLITSELGEWAIVHV